MLAIFPALSLLSIALLWVFGRPASGQSAGARALRWLLLLAGPVWLGSTLAKVSGPLFWFMLPAWCFSPVLNWIVGGAWIALVPLNNLFFLFSRLRENRRLLSESRALPESFSHWLEQRGFPEASLRAGFKVPPRITLHPDLDQPRTLGMIDALAWREVIVLPAPWLPQDFLADTPYWSTFGFEVPDSEPRDEDEIYAAILHEVGHLQGRDTLAGFLILAASLVVPSPWSDGSDRFGLLRAINSLFAGLGRPYRAFLERDQHRRERNADEFAETVLPGAKAILGGMRGESDSMTATPGPGLWRVGIGWVGALSLVLAIAWTLPGLAPLHRSLGGDGTIKGSLPAGWETLVWPAPGRPSTQPRTSWGYLPPTSTSGPQIRLHLEDPNHFLVLASSFQSPHPISGPATLRIVWEFSQERGEPNQAFDLQLVVNQIGDDETRGVFLPFRPKVQEGLERLGGSRLRITKELPILEGLRVDVIHCYWVMAKPAALRMKPPVLAIRRPGGEPQVLGAIESRPETGARIALTLN